MRKILLIALLWVLLVSVRSVETQRHDFVVEFDEPELTIFQIAAEITGCPEWVLRGIAFAESSFNANAIGDGGDSIGMFQINERFREERVRKYGEYNPYCPLDSAILTGRLFMDNLALLGENNLAIAAHRQGPGGVQRNGPTDWYVDRVVVNGLVRLDVR